MNVVDKARGLLKAREQQIKQAVNKVGGLVDDKTKGKYHDTIEKVEQKAAELVDKAAGTTPGADATGGGPGAPATPTGEKAGAEKPTGEKPAAPAGDSPAGPATAAAPAAADVAPPAAATVAETAAPPATAPVAGEAGAAAEPGMATAEEEKEDKPVPPTAGTEPSTKADVSEAAAPAGVINTDAAAADAAPTAAGTGTGAGGGAGAAQQPDHRAGEPGADPERPGSGG